MLVIDGGIGKKEVYHIKKINKVYHLLNIYNINNIVFTGHSLGSNLNSMFVGFNR